MNLSRTACVLPLLLMATLFPSMTAHAQADATGDAKARRDAAIAGLMQRYDGQVPGASLLVLKDGQPVVERGFGLANLEDHVPASPETNYRLASISKQFTAASILLLAEDGKLKLDDPVKRWLPSLPAAADAITIRHLLSHTSGLIDYEEVMPADLTGQLHDIDVLHILEGQDRTYFAPGSSYRYSNSGYALLALIVGKASGQDFASFLRQRIFYGSWALADTVALEEGVSTVVNRAYGYERRPGATGNAPTRVRPARCWVMAASIPRSGDLARWGCGALRRTPVEESLAGSGLQPRHAHAGTGRALLRLRLAHQRRLGMAFRRKHRLPQRHRALSEREAHRRPAQQPQRSGTLSHRRRHRGSVPPALNLTSDRPGSRAPHCARARR